MKHIFYFIGLCFILYELTWIFHPIKKTLESRRFYKIAKGEFKELGINGLSKQDKELLINKSITMIFYLFWFLIGLFTFNWFAFLVFLCFSNMIMAPLNRLFRDTWGQYVIHFVNSIIGLVFALFVIINSYHLKIDLWAWFQTIY